MAKEKTPLAQTYQGLVTKVSRYIEQNQKAQPFLTALKQEQFGLALRMSCRSGHSYLIKVLLAYIQQNHIDCLNESSDSNGYTALHWAAKYAKETNNYLPIKLLLTTTINKEAKDKSQKDYLSLLSERQQQQLKLTSFADDFYTFEDYMRYALYDNDHGYYSSGKVKIGDFEQAHFSTLPSKGPLMAIVILHYAYVLYDRMINKLGRSKKQPFKVVELSGGNGQLAHDFLTYLNAFANSSKGLWKDLWDSIDYVTYEISPKLANVQRSLNEKFGKKFKVKNTDALNIDEKEIDLRFSNELWDALPWNDFKRDNNGKVKIKLCVPFLKKENIVLLEKTEIREIFEYRNRYKLYLSSQNIPLNKKIFSRLRAKHKNVDDLVLWENLWLPIELVPPLHDFCDRNKAYFDTLKPNVEQHVSADMIKLAKKLSKIPTALSLDFDYAKAMHDGAYSEVRVYDQKRHHEKFDFQADVDITVDPDFRLLATILSNSQLDNTSYNYNAIFLVNIWEKLKKDLTQLAPELKYHAFLDIDNFCGASVRGGNTTISQVDFKVLACSTLFSNVKTLINPYQKKMIFVKGGLSEEEFNFYDGIPFSMKSRPELANSKHPLHELRYAQWKALSSNKTSRRYALNKLKKDISFDQEDEMEKIGELLLRSQLLQLQLEMKPEEIFSMIAPMKSYNKSYMNIMFFYDFMTKKIGCLPTMSKGGDLLNAPLNWPFEAIGKLISLGIAKQNNGRFEVHIIVFKKAMLDHFKDFLKERGLLKQQNLDGSFTPQQSSSFQLK